VPPEAIDGIRAGLGVAFQGLFVAGLVFVLITFVATLFLKVVPLDGRSPGEQATEAPGRAPARAGDGDMVMARPPAARHLPGPAEAPGPIALVDGDHHLGEPIGSL